MDSKPENMAKENHEAAGNPRKGYPLAKRQVTRSVLLDSIINGNGKLPAQLKDQAAFIRPILRAVNDQEVKDSIRNIRDNLIRSTLAQANIDAGFIRKGGAKTDTGTITLMTGVNGGEGTSWLSMMLALSLASSVHQKVAFVDGSFNPRRLEALANTFNLVQNEFSLYKGSTEVLGFFNESQPNIYFLTAPSVEESLEFFSDKELGAFLDDLRERFDYTIIDMPPLLKESANVYLAPLVDNTYLVTHAGKTNMSDIDKCVEASAQHGGEISGVILNKQKTPVWSRLFWKKYFS